ncbi:MAG TPA: four helix bundle protein [Roseiflexaceae bacterium]|nr:four helix bundle protein [Roseiflexaceae bacterium]
MGEGVDRHAALRERTKAYANRVIKLYSHLQKAYHFDDAAMLIAKQLLRSGTSAAANHREAKHSRSRAERIAKFNIILQELEESALWLELLSEHQMTSTEGLRQLLDETNQLISIFVASIKTLHSSSGDG